MKCSHDACNRERESGSSYCNQCIQLPTKECNCCSGGLPENAEHRFTADQVQEAIDQAASFAIMFQEERDRRKTQEIVCGHEHRGHCCFSISTFWWFLTKRCVWHKDQATCCVGYFPTCREKGLR